MEKDVRDPLVQQPRSSAARPPPRSQPLAVLYATREGQTRHIAEHVAARLRSRGLTVELEHVAHLPLGFSLSGHAGAILAASIHMGEHEREMVKFVKRHRTELESIPSTFLSVSLSEAGVEREATSPALRARSESDVRAMIEAFIAETGWRPQVVRPVAGALQFSRYGLVLSLIHI